MEKSKRMPSSLSPEVFLGFFGFFFFCIEMMIWDVVETFCNVFIVRSTSEINFMVSPHSIKVPRWKDMQL